MCGKFSIYTYISWKATHAQSRYDEFFTLGLEIGTENVILGDPNSPHYMIIIFKNMHSSE